MGGTVGWSASEAYEAYVTDVAEAVGAGLLLDERAFELLAELRERAAAETAAKVAARPEQRNARAPAR